MNAKTPTSTPETPTSGFLQNTGQVMVDGKLQQTGKTLSDLLLDQLAAWGIDRIFGVAGDTFLYLLDRTREHPGVTFYSCKHETAAAFMASAHSKLTGQPGVCMATAGPGLTQLLNGVGDAYMDRAPLLVLSGQVATKFIGTRYPQYLDQQQLIQPFAGYSACVSDPNRLPELLSRALHTAITQATVAHLSIPKNLFEMPVATRVVPRSFFLETPRPPEDGVISDLVRLMQEASKPVIIVGGGIAGPSQLVLQLAEAWQAAVVTSLTAKGKIDQGHPHVLGGYGQGGSQAAQDAVRQADVCLLLGTTYWPEQFMPTGKSLLQVDSCAANIGSTHPVDFGVVGTLQDVLPRVIATLGQQNKGQWLQDIQNMKTAWETQKANEKDINNPEITPGFLFGRLQETIPNNAVIALDTGDHTLWFGRLYDNLHQLLISGSWRSMGFALPAANAAALVDKNRPVIAIIGDGGMAMAQAELLTSVRYGLPVKVIVVNNGSLAMEKNRMAVGGLTPNEVDLTNPNFAQVAEACGVRGFRVTQAGQLAASLQDALKVPGPAVVDVLTKDVVVPHTRLSFDL